MFDEAQDWDSWWQRLGTRSERLADSVRDCSDDEQRRDRDRAAPDQDARMSRHDVLATMTRLNSLYFSAVSFRTNIDGHIPDMAVRRRRRYCPRHALLRPDCARAVAGRVRRRKRRKRRAPLRNTSDGLSGAGHGLHPGCLQRGRPVRVGGRGGRPFVRGQRRAGVRRKRRVRRLQRACRLPRHRHGVQCGDLREPRLRQHARGAGNGVRRSRRGRLRRRG
jgi:hypothetical protein